MSNICIELLNNNVACYSAERDLHVHQGVCQRRGPTNEGLLQAGPQRVRGGVVRVRVPEGTRLQALQRLFPNAIRPFCVVDGARFVVRDQFPAMKPFA